MKKHYFYQMGFHAICNPIIFALYVIFLSNDFVAKNAPTILGFKTFSPVGINVYSINIILFTIFSFAIYSIVLLIELYMASLFREKLFNKNIDFPRYIRSKINILQYIIILLPAFNMYGWLTGMEMTVFGMVIFIPMFVITYIYGIVHIINTLMLFSGYYDVPRNIKLDNTNSNSHLSPWNK